MEEETIRVPRGSFEHVVRVLEEIAHVSHTLGQELARLRPEMASVYRKLAEDGYPERSLREIADAIRSMNGTQRHLVQYRGAIVDARNQLRRCDPELTPVRPSSYPEMKAALDNAQNFPGKVP